MKSVCAVGLMTIFALVFAMSGVSFGQSSRCVILDKRDNLAMVNCGGATQTVNLGGAADRYRVGDSISGSEVSQQSGGTERRSGGGAKK